MHDTTLHPMDIRVAPLNDPNSEVLQLVVVVGIQTPIAIGPGQEPLILPTGVYRIPMGREISLETSEALKEQGEKLRKHSDIAVASSISDVNEAAQSLRRFTGK